MRPSSVFLAAATALLATTAFAQQPVTQAVAAAPATAQQVPPPGAQPAARPPFPNRLNSVLPQWLRVRGEFRERVEGFENSGFNEERDDLYYLSRFRFNVSTASTYFSTTVQLQDARVGNKSVGATGAPFTAKFDLRQAFADIGTAKSPLALRLGRQELAFGDMRLIGHLNWTNAARTFDAAKLTIRSKAAQVDLFGASLVRILDGEFDKSGNGHRLYGAYVNSAVIIPRGTVEPYVFYRQDEGQRPEVGAPADLKQATTGLRLTGRAPAALDYIVEMDAQRGSLGGDNLNAWAGRWQLRATLPGTKTPHVTGEYNFASGDRDPGDGTRGTFDQLYPTGHDRLGLANQVGWRNIRQLRVGFDVTPFRATPITVNFHSYWLAEKRDALYNALGAAIARVPAGAASAKVGHELDLQIARPLTPQLALAAGYSHLFAGPFLKEATPGKSYTGPFVMLTYVFFAER